MPTPVQRALPRRPYKGSRVLGPCRRKSTMCTSVPVSPDGGASGSASRMPSSRRSEVKSRGTAGSPAPKVLPLLAPLEVAAEKQKTLSRRPELAKAFGYALNQWPALIRYAEDGWVVDNNIAENALRRSVWGENGCSSARIMVVSAVRHCTVLSDVQIQTAWIRNAICMYLMSSPTGL